MELKSLGDHSLLFVELSNPTFQIPSSFIDDFSIMLISFWLFISLILLMWSRSLKLKLINLKRKIVNFDRGEGYYEINLINSWDLIQIIQKCRIVARHTTPGTVKQNRLAKRWNRTPMIWWEIWWPHVTF